MATTGYNFECEFCGKHYVRESSYLDHECRQMKRQREMKTPLGQAAWTYYQNWFRAMRKQPPRVESFLDSRYYQTFTAFASFVVQVQLPMPEKFIWLMVTKNYQPSMWTMDAVYVQYLDFLDYKAAPLEHVKHSIDVLFKVASRYDIDVAEVFDYIDVNDLIQLVRTRQVSPWLLLFSKGFKMCFANRANEEQQAILETLIKPDTWSARFTAHSKVIPIIKLLIKEMGI